jgi:hypothetical protein
MRESTGHPKNTDIGGMMAIVKITGKEALKIKGTTDWNAVDALTDDEITEASKSDPDSAYPSDEELKDFKRGLVKKPEGK